MEPGAASDGELTVWLDRAFVDKVEIERVVPEPIAMAAGSDRILYRFAVAAPEQSTAITFHIELADFGATRGRVGLVDGAEITFDQFIFP